MEDPSPSSLKHHRLLSVCVLTMSANGTMIKPNRQNEETQPLLRRESQLDSLEGGDSRELIQFKDGDEGNPKAWKYSEKLTNIGVIATMAIMSPLASSMFTPGIQQIADGLDTTPQQVISCKYTHTLR